MTAAWTAALAAALVLVPGIADEPSSAAGDPQQAVRSALGDQSYPWYDASRDAVRPVMAEPGSWSRRLRKWLDSVLDWLGNRLGRREPGSRAPRTGSPAGQFFSTLLMLAAGALFAFLLWRLWRLHDVGLSSGPDGAIRVGDAARIAGLGPGMSLEGMDPWAEALRRRAGDPAGAVVWLFLDQLVSLQRVGLIRLTPGKTARQYAQGLKDPVLAEGLQATLGAFEQVYYGRRLPAPATLQRVWACAEQFRGRIQAIEGEP